MVTGFGRMLLVASLALVSLTGWSVDDPYQTFVTTDSTQFRAVMLRKLDRYYVMATRKGVQTVRKGDILVAGAMTDETVQIDQILSLIEDYIRAGEYSRVAGKVPELRSLADRFKARVQNDLDSSAKPVAQKETLRYAIAYFENELATIGPTLEILDLITDVRDAHSKFRQDLLLFDQDTLTRLINYQKRFNRVTVATPLVEKDRNEAQETLNLLLNAVTGKLREEVVSGVRETRDYAPAISLLSTLKQGEGENKIFPAEENLLVDSTLEISRTAEEGMLSTLAESMKLREKLCVISDSDYQVRRDVLKRLVVPGLRGLATQTFGEEKAAHETRLQDQATHLDSVLRESAERRDLMAAIQSRYDTAEKMFLSRQFAAAAAEYEALMPMVQQARLSSEGMYTRVVNQALRSHAEYLLRRIRTPQATETRGLQALMDEATKFLEANGDALAELGYARTEFTEEIQALDLYRVYRERYDLIEANKLAEPMRTWLRVLYMNEWLTEHSGVVLPQAVKQWQAFLAENEDAIFNRARDVFFEDNSSLNDEKNQETFASFVQKFIENKEYDRALSAIDKALASQGVGDAFINRLLQLQLQISDQLSADGELIRSSELYKDIIENYPNFATRHNVTAMLAAVQQAIADQLVAEGKQQAAIELYESICVDFRSYAQKNNLLKRLLELKTAQLGYQAGGQATDEVLAMFNKYCELFPGYLSNLQDIRALKKQLTDEFRDDWREDRPQEAVKRFQDMCRDYPSLSQEMQLPRQILVVTRNQLARVNAQVEDENARGITTVRNETLQAAGDLLAIPETKDLSQRPLTENLYISLLLHRADEHFQVGQIARGYAIYDQILNQYPEVAEEQNVKQIMADKQWDLKMEKVRRPLGIKSGLDWFFLVLWIVVWGAFLVYARRRGKAQGELKYRMQHFMNAFGVFFLFLVIFLIFNLSQTSAFLLSFCLPGILFNVLGCATFMFFPLVYWERRLLVEKGLLWLAEESPLSRLTGGTGPQPLVDDIERLEKMVSLMNDRRRFEVHMAIKTSEKDPTKGLAWLHRILERLEAERSEDKVWRLHHKLVIHQLGVIAYQQGDNAEARKYLNQYIDYEPKDLEARDQLSELTYNVGDYEEAIPHLKVLLAAHSHDDSLWYRLGRAFFETDKHVAAYKCFETAKKKDRDILFYGARSFARANERERAVKWYQGLLKKFGQDTESVYYFASTLAEMGESAKALKVAGVIKEEDAYYPSALALQGNILFKKNELEKAGKIFHKSLELSPNFIQALLGFGQVLVAAGKLDTSMKYFQRILEQDPKHPAGNYFVGVLLQEKGETAKAVEHLKLAVTSSGFRRWAARRIGYISYFADDLESAVEYLAIAQEAGESSPWILFLLAYSLAKLKDLRRCEQILIKILGRGTGQTKEWTQETATRAMYMIGTALFQEHAYKMAHQCFEFVRENPIINTDVQTVDDYIEESRFRMVVNWLQRGEYIEAQARCSELQLEAQEDKRFHSCQYYLSLCQLYQGQYSEASNLLGSLVKQDPNNPRYLYHQIVAELGAGREDMARAAMNSFAGMSNRPAHLAAGLVTIQAYLNARRGKVQDAERSLARVSLPDGDSPGDRYLREKIVLARIFYLCHLHDYDTIAKLMEELSEDKRSHALYLQAVSSLQRGDFSRAREFLKPFADRSERDRQLFTYISARLAIGDLSEHLDRDAKKILQDIPKPPKEIKNLMVAWEVSDRLTEAENLGELDELIGLLKGRLGQMEDEYFNYFILHNLSVLLLKRAYIVEDSEAKTDDKLAAWIECMDFWYSRVIPSGEYWNMAQSRFEEEGKAVRPFPANELDSIMQAAKDQYFINVFVGYVLYYLSIGDETSLSRHMKLMREVAERDGKLKAYFRRLGEKVERYLRSIPKTNPLWNSWDFSVASLDLQVGIADVLGLDNSVAIEQLELFRQTRKLYDSPTDYQQAKRQFNTLLLETIQIGVRGNFSEAGEMLDKCLNGIPPGVDLGKVVDSLKLLREACRNPAAYAERGVNLSLQFEKAYATVRTINITKGKGDGNSKRS